MKGTRPLDRQEIQKVYDSFNSIYQIRNRSLFMLGVSTGGRISELLSLTIGDVYQNSSPVRDLLFDKSIVKGKEHARSVPVNSDGRAAIADVIKWHRTAYSSIAKKRPLFPSRNGKGSKQMSRRAAHDVLKTAFEKAGLNGKLATHSLRKSFAQRLYDRTGDIYAVREMLGHKHISTTQKYLGVNYQNVRAAVEAMAINAELHIRDILGSSLKEATDEKLLLELATRGYDLSTLKEKKSQCGRTTPTGQK